MRLLDLYCCAGGAAAGYSRAGFTVITGVDILPQPHYPFQFLQDDALEVLADLVVNGPGASDLGFDAIHASPPCQAYTKARKLQGNTHPDLVGPTRELLEKAGVPWVIENVVGAPLNDPVTLCGTMFGLKTYRHRLFETNWELTPPAHPEHVAKQTKMGRPPVEGEFMQVVGHYSGAQAAREAMGIDWMNQREMAEAIPPAYTEFIGAQLIREAERCSSEREKGGTA